jgi:geranylgeranyl pyrophosphate synthase
MDEAVEHIERALEAMESFPASTERDALIELARYIVDRSS